MADKAAHCFGQAFYRSLAEALHEHDTAQCGFDIAAAFYEAQATFELDYVRGDPFRDRDAGEVRAHGCMELIVPRSGPYAARHQDS